MIQNWNWSKFKIGSKMKWIQIQNWPKAKIGQNSKLVQNWNRSNSNLVKNWSWSNSKLVQIWKWSKIGVGPYFKLVQIIQFNNFQKTLKSIHVNPVMSRRGYLLVLEQGSSHWTRRFVVVRRPYLLFYRSARDPVERSIINLSTAVVEYSADKQVRNKKLNP